MEPKPLLIFDGERKVSAATPGTGAVLGRSEQSLPGLACREVFACPNCAGDACPLRQALAGEAVEGLVPAGLAGGPVAVNASPIQTANDRLAVLQLRIPEPEEVALGAGLQRVLDVLRVMTGSDMAALAFYDEATRDLRWQVTSGGRNPGSTALRLRPGEGFAGRILMTDLPLRTFRFPHDLTEHADAYPIFLAEGLKAALGVPIRGDDRVVGVLMVASRQEREYPEADLARLTGVAGSLALAAQMMGVYGEALRAERAHLAHEVHDGLSQNLFGLKLLLFDLQQQYQGAAPGARQQLAEVCRLLDSTLLDVRRLIADLRQTARAESGLAGALSDCLVRFYRLTNVPTELAVRLAPGEDVLCSDRAEVLRIVEEALMNVQRHAGAAHVWVELARADGRCRITIRDDGGGFDPAAVPEGHFGLATMRERAARLQGEVQIASALGRGTVVTILLPV
jgi:signal transduction histidine kinase